MAELLDTLLTPSSLEMRYRFEASPEALFAAWTEPEILRQWFRVSPDYTTPIAEVDLRVGGRYRLGMRTPEGEDIVAGGNTARSAPRKNWLSHGNGRQRPRKAHTPWFHWISTSKMVALRLSFCMNTFNQKKSATAI